MSSQRKLIRECTWEEVFIEWYKAEGQDPTWIKLAQERGFASWADWRLKGYAERFECHSADWGFYHLTNLEELLNWYGGPFRTWIEKYYQGAQTKTFAEIVMEQELQTNDKVLSMTKNYPLDSVITALELADGRTMVIEGSHRLCALVMMIKQGHKLPQNLIFAIGKSQLDSLPVVGQNTAK